MFATFGVTSRVDPRMFVSTSATSDYGWGSDQVSTYPISSSLLMSVARPDDEGMRAHTELKALDQRATNPI